MRTYVIGDIHGAYKALIQCLQRANFNYQDDRLIALGDVCDGYPEVRESIDELLKIKNCDYIIGNHDLWVLDWAKSGDKPEIWTSQGGSQTIASYNGGPIPQKHVDFLKRGRLWIEAENKLFVHAGFDPDIPLEKQKPEVLVWDRELFERAWKRCMFGSKEQFGRYEDIFIGHTPTQHYNSSVPVHFCNIWGMDTAAGWSGRLTIMDIETKEYWQSDLTPDIYGVSPRSA